MKVFCTFLVQCITAWTLQVGAAQAFPVRTVKLIVPTNAGTMNSAIARLMADRLAQRWNVPVVVEHKPGGGGAIAVNAMLQAPTDGHTLLWGSTMLVAPSDNPNTPSRVQTDQLLPLTLLGEGAVFLFARSNFPGTTAQEIQKLSLIAKGLSCGHGGGITKIACTALSPAGVGQFQAVGYQSAVQALPDLVDGRLDLYFAPLHPAFRPLLQSGKVRLIARSIAVPGAPAEFAGVPLLSDSDPRLQLVNWLGAVLVSQATPSHHMQILYESIHEAAAAPEIVRLMNDNGFRTLLPTPEVFQTMWLQERARLSSLANGTR